jgi:hypothetical protein
VYILRPSDQTSVSFYCDQSFVVLNKNRSYES